jgi:hypothetical protein
VRRESYVGPWLPEPITADPAPDAAASAELADEPSEDPPVAPPNRRSPDPGWSLWGDLEP